MADKANQSKSASQTNKDKENDKDNVKDKKKNGEPVEEELVSIGEMIIHN
jgi:hypothetical protein